MTAKPEWWSPTLKVRGSSADRVLHCAGSLEPSTTTIDDDIDVRNTGTAGHDYQHQLRSGDNPVLERTAAFHDVDADELELLAAFAEQCWAKVGQWFPQLRTEVPVVGPVTKGTADLVSVIPELDLAVGDYKMGYQETSHVNQLRAYADALRHEHGMPASGYITGVEIWVRLRRYEVHRFTEAELDGFRDRMRRQLDRAGRQYAAGSWCRWCPHQHTCDTKAEWVRGTAAQLTVIDDGAMVSRQELADLYAERYSEANRALQRFAKMVRRELVDGGPIELSDGRWLRLVSKDQQKIQYSKAVPVLLELLEADDIDGVLSVSKSSLMAAVKDGAPHGQGAARGRAAMAKLREVDAVTTRTKVEMRVEKDRGDD